MRVQRTINRAVVAGLALAMTMGPGTGVAFATDAAANQLVAAQDQQASAAAAATVASAIGEQPTITGMEQDGFAHPSIGFSKESLELMQTKLREGYDPWVSALNTFAQQPNAALDYQTRNSNPADPTKPLYTNMAGDAQAREGKVDGNAAWCQAVMYVATGNVQYRKNCMDILRKWGQVRQTTDAFNDSHISSSEAVYPMVRAAELMRYTSTPADAQDLAWTQEDTDNFTAFLESLRPLRGFYHVNTRHMNQQSIANRLYLAIAIFENNTDYYKEAVEWTLANKTYVSEDGGVYGRNGALYIQVRNVDVNAYSGEKLTPHYQVSEMGRDQFHPKDGLDAIAANLQAMSLQGTKVNDDPTAKNFGEVDPNGVTPFEFMGNRLLKGYNQLSKYNLGYDINWTPIIADEGGSAVLPTYSDNGVAPRTEDGKVAVNLYSKPSGNGRGGNIYNSQLIAHYTFDNTSEGWDSQDTRYIKEAFDKAGGQYDAETVLVDGNEAMTGAQVGRPQELPGNPYGQNQAAYDRNQFFNYYGRSESVSTNTYADDDGTRSVLYDVKGSGQFTWYKMHFDSDVDHITAHLASKANGAKRGTLVDVVLLDGVKGLDEKNVTKDDLKAGKTVATIVLPDTGAWTKYTTASQPLQIMDKDTGKPISDVSTIPAGDHIIAFRYYDNYGNSLNYQIAADWFTFSKHYANQTNAATDADELQAGAKASDGAVSMPNASALLFKDMNYDNGLGAGVFDYASDGDGVVRLELADGTAIASYRLPSTNGERKTATVALEGATAKNLAGRNDVKLVFEGASALKLYSYANVQVPYVTQAAEQNYELEDHALADEARKSRIVAAKDDQPGYLQLDDGGFAMAPAPSFPSSVPEGTFVTFRVRTNGMATLELLSNTNSATPYQELYIPDTQGAWQNISFDLHGTGYNGAVLYMRMKSLSGDATKLDIDYKQNNPANKPPVLAASDQVAMGASGETVWDLKASDAENDAVSFDLIGNVPNGVSVSSDGKLHVAAGVAPNSEVYVRATDGTSTVVKKYTLLGGGSVDAQIAEVEQQVGDTAQYGSVTLAAYRAALDAVKQANASTDKSGVQDLLAQLRDAASALRVVDPHREDGVFDLSKGVVMYDANSGATLSSPGSLSDGSKGSFVETKRNDDQAFAGFVLDMGEGFAMKAKSFQVVAHDQFGFDDEQNRIAGTYVEGSNDNEHWTTLTDQVADDVNEQTLENSKPEESYRYFRIITPADTWKYQRIAELHIDGTCFETAVPESELSTLSIASNGSDAKVAHAGDTVTLTAAFKSAVKEASARVNGQDAAVKVNGDKVVATYRVGKDAVPGSVIFSLTADGKTYYATTDSSAVVIASAQTANEQAKALKAISAPALGGNKLALPQIPGFTVSVESSSNEELVAKDGTWKAGTEAADVTLKLRVTSVTDSSDTAISDEIKVTLPAKADTSKLQASIDFTQDLQEEDVAAIQSALDEAKAVLADANASELQIAVANLKLVEAIHDLNNYLPDHEMLRQLADASKDVYDALDTGYADGADKDAFKSAYEAAVAALDDAMTSAETIQSGYLALKDAAAAIVDEKLDSAELQAYVDAYASVSDTLDEYTTTSGKAFTDAMAKAKDVLAHPGSQQNISDASAALKAAFEGLTRRADADAVNAAVKHAEGFLDGDYATDSLAVLKDAIAAAKDVAGNTDATYEQGTAAVQKLYDAVAKLVKNEKPADPNKPSDPGKPEQPGNPEQPADPSKPSTTPGGTPGAAGDKGQSAQGGQAGSGKAASKSTKSELPQTGDTVFTPIVAALAAGVASVAAGTASFFKRRRDE